MALPRLPPRTPTSSPRAAEGSGLAAEKITEHRNRAASPRLYMDGYVPGGRSKDITLPSQG